MQLELLVSNHFLRNHYPGAPWLQISAIYDGSNFDNEDAPAIIKSIVLNGDTELLFALLVALPQ